LKHRFVHTIGVAAIAALTISPANAPAAPSGLAWDSVTKMAMGADPSTLQPGSFDDDFAAASAPQQSSGGGMFGKMVQGMMGNMQGMMQNGLAERHYVADSKERTDEVAQGRATITDCVARTITTLDLNKKTYSVVSMDQPSSPGSGGTSSGGSMPKDDGTKVAIAVKNTALGSRQVGGEPTNGYSSQMTFTVTNASGESHTQNTDMLGYYASFGTPVPQCTRGSWNPAIAAGAGPAAVASMSRMLQALKSAGIDKRFSITQSGPHLPLGGFAMFQAMSFGGGGGHSAAFVIERGDVHAVDANDPIFGIPAGFTQVR
jgi:hypothetical protein